MYAVKGFSARAIVEGMALEDGEVIMDSIPVSRDLLIFETKNIISKYLDGVVQSKGYDNIVSCISYVGDGNSRFDSEARSAMAWRSAVYEMAYSILENAPDGVSEPDHVIELLPKPEEFGWIND